MDLKTIKASLEELAEERGISKEKIIDYIPGDNDFMIINKERLNDKQLNALNFINEKILSKRKSGTGVQDILNKAVFDLLRYIVIFPAGSNKLADKDGNILPDCFLLPENSTAYDFASIIHSDLAKNFVKAIDARTKRVLGKEYKLKNGDAIEIIT